MESYSINFTSKEIECHSIIYVYSGNTIKVQVMDYMLNASLKTVLLLTHSVSQRSMSTSSRVLNGIFFFFCLTANKIYSVTYNYSDQGFSRAVATVAVTAIKPKYTTKLNLTKTAAINIHKWKLVKQSMHTGPMNVLVTWYWRSSHRKHAR